MHSWIIHNMTKNTRSVDVLLTGNPTNLPKSEAKWQTIWIEIKLLGNFVHQVLAGGEAFAVAAEFESMGTEVVWDVAKGIIRIIGNQAMEPI